MKFRTGVARQVAIKSRRRATMLPLWFVVVVQAAALLVLCSVRCAAMSDEERATIVQLHNEIRNSVALGKLNNWPAASDMQQMSYSNELEELAKTHLENCVFEPGCIGCNIGLDNRPGQNLYAMAGPANWTRAVNFWGQAPIDFVMPTDPDNPVRMKVSVLSQLLWSKSNKVGCAWKDCYPKTGNSLYLCNYMPAGNEYGGHVYMSGKACSRCPQGTCCSNRCPHKTEPSYEGLCAPQ
uniref:Antigen 5 family member n=1 Tax=Rhipicephalus zambeziensis TaxID=60191 RepID=A0A224YBR6_9ACAR